MHLVDPCTGQLHVASEKAVGEDCEWARWLPEMWRILADPEGTHVFPTRAHDLDTACAWWGPILHLLAYSLGWPRIDLGLQRWWDAGRPTDDPRLALVDAAWGDAIVEFIAWCETSDDFVAFSNEVAAQTHTDLELHGPVGLDPAIEGLVRLSESDDSPYFGGTDPLHLSHHGLTPVWEGNGTGRLDVGTFPHATLVVDGYRGWYRELHALGATLPPSGSRSWRVDVVCRPLGWLGTYRRSRVSGRWFSGQHRHHALGY